MTRTKTTVSIQLQQCEDKIETAETWDQERAKALLQIQRQRLWEDQYESFEDYGVKRWGYDNSYLYRQCEWAKVIEVLPIGRKPERESHARPLYGLTPDQQRTIWKAVDRHTDTPTAAIVSEMVTRHLSRSTQQKSTKSLQRVSGSVIRADAIKGLGTLADGSIDLILTSPPFCEQRKRDFPSVKEKDFPQWMVQVMEGASSKLKTTGNVIIEIREHVRGGQISDYLLRTRLAIRESGWRECDVLISYRPDSPPLGRPERPRRTYSYLLWYSLTDKPYCNSYDCGEDRKTRIKCKSTKNTLHSNGNNVECFNGAKARVSDVITSPGGSIARGVDHPAMYSEVLADQIIRTFSPVGGLVADPFCGSGTTLIAARDAERNWWGCDLVRRFVQMSRKRLD